MFFVGEKENICLYRAWGLNCTLDFGVKKIFLS